MAHTRLSEGLLTPRFYLAMVSEIGLKSSPIYRSLLAIPGSSLKIINPLPPDYRYSGTLTTLAAKTKHSKLS